MIRIFDCAQNSAEWYEARRGIPTASEFAAILTKGKGSEPSKVRATYMRKLAGELVTGEPMPHVTTFVMERGKMLEDDARNLYAFTAGADLKQVGFVRNEDRGASPDSLVGNNGMLEIKSKEPHLLVEVILADVFPEDHKAQCQGALLVAEREWIDIACYWPKMPLFTKRAYRDEPYLKHLSGEIDRFNDELREMVAKVRAYGSMKEAA